MEVKYLIPIALVLFIIFRRIKRTIGFQKYRKGVMITRIVIFSLVSLIILVVAALKPSLYIADAIGIIAGLTLLFFAIKNTIFEKRADGLYYRTHIWIELTVLILFLGRFLYRFYKIYELQKNGGPTDDMDYNMQNMREPITSAVFLLICAYYIGYFAFILKHGKKELESE